ncbi:hypothetical protein LCGC14_1492930 [marine sediment metagenome]|uniref:Uncharacterized protein n=1 Tax=marine sediment metagenome TaxID=412755 RepID=A0A0F9J6Z4_9ZZZZ
MSCPKAVCQSCGRHYSGWGLAQKETCDDCGGKLIIDFPNSIIIDFVKKEGKPPDDTLGTRVLKTLVSRTINDITYEQMNRIVRRLSRMPQTERGIPVRVADLLADELGPQKALVYIDKALAAGQIKAREYDEMRSALLLPIPRKEIPDPTIRKMAAELVQGQERLREDFRKLTDMGQEAFRKPFEKVNEDVKRIKKAWGLK